MKKVAIIGAGAAGLTATKRLSEPNSGCECCTFEQSDNVGGTWVYTDKVGKDEFGIPVHSSMYQGLRTNLPKEIMALPGLPHKGKSSKSYVTSQEVLDYFEEYADHFDLRKYMKFRHRVNMVSPMPNGQWKIIVTDLKQQITSEYYFDAVVVCIGNYSNPVYPNVKGVESFEGIQLHSHDYKEPSIFSNKTVVVIGAGPSGLDISSQISGHANEVYLAHHSEKAKLIDFPDNVFQKPDPSEISGNEITFSDGSIVQADAIVYCTGYEYKYPFLSPECKITVDKMVVKPLYKHFINIEHPTMCIIGIPRDCPGFTMFDLQIRCFINILNNEVTLPSKEVMYEETEADIKNKKKKSGKEKHYHIMNKDAQQYFDSLSFLGNLPKAKQIVFDIYFHGMERMIKDFKNFRSEIYRLIDDQRYVVMKS